MKRGPDAVLNLIVTVLIGLFVLPSVVKAAGVVGNGTPAGCTEAELLGALVGGGFVSFDCGTGSVVIVLTSQWEVTQDTIIDGDGKITLSGGGGTRLFLVRHGSSLQLNYLTLYNGSSSPGGSIFNNGSLTIENSTLLNNAAPGGTGGAIYNRGEAAITNSLLSGNTALVGLFGAIHNLGSLTIKNSIFSNNSAWAGGAIGNAGNANIVDSIFAGNHASSGSGAIENESVGVLSVQDSTFSGNASSSGNGAAIGNFGSITVLTSIFTSNAALSGGSITNEGTATITNSSLTYNSADNNGGGIANYGTLALNGITLSENAITNGLGSALFNGTLGAMSLTNCTLSGNASLADGGAIATAATMTVHSSSIVNNTGGGFLVGGGVHAMISNTLLAQNGSFNCNGAVSSQGYNLESGNSCGFTATGDLPNTDPLVAPLADNGGTTQTHALLVGSPAINAGTTQDCPATDQRGVARPQRGICDIGAFEYQFASNWYVIPNRRGEAAVIQLYDSSN